MTIRFTCPICGNEEANCQRTHLCKANGDPFDYLIGLRDGRVIRISCVSVVAPGWVHLETYAEAGNVADAKEPEWQIAGHPCPRGLDVRLDFIAWVADAPAGS